jgi:hypothetical protein
MHTPKTGGRYIINNVLDPIREQLKNNNIEIINIKRFDHSNWYSKIDDDTYVITVLREPASQTISLYAHVLTTNSGGVLKTNTEFNLLKNEFYETIKNNSNYQNFQSKTFLRDEAETFSLRANEITVDEGILEKRINRVNLLLNNNNLSENSTKIQEKIFLDLGIDGIPQEKKSNGIFYNPYSRYFYDTFSAAEKDSIATYNKIDTNLYKNANYSKI